MTPKIESKVQGAPAGADLQLQYNRAGVLGADANLIWDYTNFRLGINQPAPAYDLDVDGDINVTGAFRIGGTPLSPTPFSPAAAGNDTWVQYNASGVLTADVNLAWDYTNQRLGINNPTPAFSLDVVGDMNVSGVYRVMGAFLISGGTGEIQFNNDNSQQKLQSNPNFIWDDVGHFLGVGTNVPDTKLHVVGSIKMIDGNQAAGKIMTSDANGLGAWATSVSTPGGADQQIQFNDGGVFGTDTDFVFDKTTHRLTLGANLDSSSQILDVLAPVDTDAVRITDNSTSSMTLGTLSAPVGNKIFSDNILVLGGGNTPTIYVTAGAVGFNNGAPAFPIDTIGQINTDTGYCVSGVQVLTGALLNLTGSWTDSASSTIALPGDGSITLSNAAGSSISLAAAGKITLSSATDVEIKDVGNGKIRLDGSANLLFENIASLSMNGTPGISAGPFTTITTITVVNGIVTDLQGS